MIDLHMIQQMRKALGDAGEFILEDSRTSCRIEAYELTEDVRFTVALRGCQIAKGPLDLSDSDQVILKMIQAKVEQLLRVVIGLNGFLKGEPEETGISPQVQNKE